jgi:hypothetical protein
MYGQSLLQRRDHGHPIHDDHETPAGQKILLNSDFGLQSSSSGAARILRCTRELPRRGHFSIARALQAEI